MAVVGVKISTLRELVNLASDDYFVVNDASQITTKKITYENMFNNLPSANVVGTLSFGSLKDTAEDITITKFVDAADGIVDNNNDTSIPTTAAIKSYVDGELSDYRAKSNLKPFTGALDKIADLEIYEYNVSTSLSKEIGVIAHELQEKIPYLVNGEKDEVYDNGNPKFQTVSYSKMVPILLAAIQELRDEVNQLKTQIERG